MNPARPTRRLAATACAVVGLFGAVSAPAHAADPKLDLENLTASQLAESMKSGSLTSVQLTRAYLNRIAALNKRGPSLNAVRILNANALAEAKASDARRAAGTAGPLEGLPVLVKDNLDVAGLPTTAGAVALENNVPATDSPVVARLRAAGAVLLGKTNLSEFANFFSSGTNPSGYSSLGGQVLNATDASSTPSGSSSGSAVAASTGLAALTIGTETSGSIISPSAANGDVGLRPTVGLVPRPGIIPISATQDTAGPIVRSVRDAAMELQAIAGKDPEDSASDTAPATVPNYTTGLSTDALQGKRIAIITSTDPTYNAAVATVQAAGATTINIGTNPTSLTVPSTNPSVLTSEFRRDLNAYLARVTAKGGHAGQPTLNDVITYNSAHPEEGLKFGQGTLISSQAVDLTDPAQNAEYQAKVTSSKQNAQASINAALNLNDGDPSNDIDGILTTSGGTTGIGARAGYPQLTIPAGFSASSRNPVGISFQGTAYSEAKLLAMGYAFEQATQARTGPAVTNPSIERCADVAQPKPFAERSCMPSGEQIMASIGGAAPSLGFSLEKASATDVQTLMKTKKLTSVSLTKGYLARIAAVNNAGPAINAVRSLNPSALADAAASDRYRRTHATPRALEGLPILVKDNLDVAGLPTTGGSIALQNTVPKSDSTVVDKLRAAGAVILGKTNMTEFDNLMSTATTGSGATLASFMPAGYSSLGGYTLNPYDTDLIQGGGGPGAGTANTSIVGNGGSAGSASAAAAGLAAMTVGTETNGGIVFPSSANSVVGMRPTYGTVSRAGMLPVAKSQDTPGAIGRTVTDVATELQAIVGKDGDDAATSGAPASAPDYLTGLTTNALSGKRIGVTNSTNANYVAANAALAAAGATLVTITAPAPAATASVFPYEFKRDLNAYLSSSDISTDRKSLKGVISYNNANEDEALKFGQGQLAAAQATDTSSGSADTTAYAAAVTAGRTASQDAITAVLNNGTPADPTDDLAAIVLPQDSRTQDTTYTAGARAGFPQISVPAGYNLPTSPTTSTTHDPVAVTFLGAANADAALLGLAYAYEQQSQLRKAPSEINPATWRCSPDSAFPARSCAPGDYLTAVSETPQAPATPVTTPPVTTPPVTPPVVLPVPTIGNPTISRTTSFKVSPKTRQVAVRVKCGVSSGSRCKGTITIKSGAVVIASRTFSIPAGKTTTVRLKLSASAYRTLVTRKKLPVSIKVTTRGSDGRTRTSAVNVTLKPLALR